VGNSRFLGHDDEIGSIASEGRRPFDPAPADLRMNRAAAPRIYFFRVQESRSDKKLMGGGLAQQYDVAIVVSAQESESLVVSAPVKIFDAIGFEFGDAMAG
jgi:hypothetical protein